MTAQPCNSAPLHIYAQYQRSSSEAMVTLSPVVFRHVGFHSTTSEVAPNLRPARHVIETQPKRRHQIVAVQQTRKTPPKLIRHYPHVEKRSGTQATPYFPVKDKYATLHQRRFEYVYPSAVGNLGYTFLLHKRSCHTHLTNQLTSPP